MGYILVVWVAVGGYSSTTYKDWRPIGEFQTSALCETAAKQLVPVVAHRCLRQKEDAK